MGLSWSDRPDPPPNGTPQKPCIKCNKCPANPETMVPWRPRWPHQLDFTMSGISWIIGIQSLLVFPYMMANYGGVAFLVPYLLFTIFVSFPLLFMDISLGQFSSKGLLSCWECAPFFKGVGVGKLLMSLIYNVHFAVLMAWFAYYFAMSFYDPLPWSDCVGDSIVCSDQVQQMNETQCTNQGLNATSGVCMDGDTLVGVLDQSDALANGLVVTGPYAFFSDSIGGSSWMSAIGTIGKVHWYIVLATLVVWVLAFLALAPGIKVFGKVAYIVTIGGVALQIALLVRGLMLEGSWEGVKQIMAPDWSVLTEKPRVWMYGFNLAVFSLNFGLGGWSTLSSYNKFRRNYLWDVIVFIVVNVVWSLLSAITIFAFTSYLVSMKGGDILGTLENGIAYSVLVIPEVVLTLTYPQAWSAVFYMLLFLTGFGTLIVVVENIITSVADVLHDFHKPMKRASLVGLVCVLLFAVCIILCTDAGAFVVILLQEFISARNLTIIMVAKIVVICYIYGYTKFIQDITCMLGKRKFLFAWMAVSWLLVIPVALLVFFIWWVVAYLLEFEDIQFLGFTYPIYWTILGWILAWFPILVMVLFSVWLVCSQFNKESKLEQAAVAQQPVKKVKKIPKHKTLRQSSHQWGPIILEDRISHPRYDPQIDALSNTKGTVISLVNNCPGVVIKGPVLTGPVVQAGSVDKPKIRFSHPAPAPAPAPLPAVMPPCTGAALTRINIQDCDPVPEPDFNQYDSTLRIGDSGHYPRSGDLATASSVHVSNFNTGSQPPPTNAMNNNVSTQGIYNTGAVNHNAAPIQEVYCSGTTNHNAPIQGGCNTGTMNHNAPVQGFCNTSTMNHNAPIQGGNTGTMNHNTTVQGVYSTGTVNHNAPVQGFCNTGTMNHNGTQATVPMPSQNVSTVNISR